jgi:hypothetical protein
MNLRLIAIKYENYKNILSGQFLRLSEITSLVGANETGKSNLLYSLSLLDLESGFSKSDTTFGTGAYNNGLSPTLSYYFLANAETISLIRKYLKNFSDNNLLILRRSNDEVEYFKSDLTFGEQNSQFVAWWKNKSQNSVTILDVNNQEILLAPNKSICGLGVKGMSIARNVRLGLLEKLTDEDVKQKFTNDISEFIPNVRRWKFDEDKDYLKEKISLDEFLGNPDNFAPIKNIFLLAGSRFPDALKYKELLTNKKLDIRDLGNYLDDVCGAANDILSSQWREEIEIRIEPVQVAETVMLQISLMERGARVEPGVRSDGLKWFMSFILKFTAAGENNNIYVFDQPGDSLHPGGQHELLKRFEEVIERNQIVYATHSPFLINRNQWKSVQFLEKKDGLSTISEPSKIDIENDKLLRSSLGFTISDIGEANDDNVVVEGYWDKLTLKLYRKTLNREPGTTLLDSNYVSILDSEGAPKIKARVEELTESGLNAVGIYDYDAEVTRTSGARSARGRLLSISTISRGKVYTGEDLIPHNVYESFLEKAKELNGYHECFDRQVIELLSQSPGRLSNLKKYFAELGIEFTRDLKNDCWVCISAKLEQAIDNAQGVKFLEYKLARVILKAADKKLMELKD